jgi:alpha-galactosidase/6-phospho-beta-glucosidase family protein
VILTPAKEIVTSKQYATHARSQAVHQPSGKRQFQRKRIPVEAALAGDPRLVFQTICYAPLTAAMLSLAETKEMVNEMLQQNRDYLPQFEHSEV